MPARPPVAGGVDPLPVLLAVADDHAAEPPEDRGGRRRGGSAGRDRSAGSSTGRAGRRGRSAPAGDEADAEPDADPETVARTIVLRKLAAQARTRQELAKALTAREVPEEVAAKVLDRMEAVGLVNDAVFAQDWVQSRQQRRHLSKSALRRELQGKGVDRDLIDDAVAEVEGDDEVVAAEALAVKKLRSMQGLDRQVQYRRLAGALARRGFSPGVTTTVLARVLSDRDDAHA